jgi:hypothetical protein
MTNGQNKNPAMKQSGESPPGGSSSRAPGQVDSEKQRTPSDDENKGSGKGKSSGEKADGSTG